MQMHAYVHDDMIHTCMHACIHTYIHTCIHAFIDTSIHSLINDDIYTYTHIVNFFLTIVFEIHPFIHPSIHPSSIHT